MALNNQIHPGARPIENHGVVGDLATIALVGLDACIDFLCWPRFDSPTVFASLLDPEKGGEFRIGPLLDHARHKQLYLPDTNVLLTRFLSADGVAEITDFMPLLPERPALIRMVRTVRGQVRWRMSCAPRFDYARRGHALHWQAEHHEAVFVPEGVGLSGLRLSSAMPMTAEGNDVCAEFTLAAGESTAFVLDGGDGPARGPDAVRQCFESTVAYWQKWAGQSIYRGRWREIVQRSALVLKLLSSAQYGSIIAAGTFGLPEVIGGERNWDYRYAWVRDAAFTVYALIRLGYTGEARSFMAWVQGLSHRRAADGQLQIMYGLDGRPDLPEQQLAHLAGYAGSQPVRIGNAAYGQLQLDIYGELMDAVYLSCKYGEPVSHDAWTALLHTLDWVCDHWHLPDEGIWEVRGGRREFLHSRLMCWVAVDRALRLAQKRSLPADFRKLMDTRNAIHRDIYANFWDEELQAFVQHKGGKALDAAVLLMPLVRFISATDPRWLSTLDAIGRRLADDALVRRYDLQAGADDGLAGTEGSFTCCSFWYIECLARAGRVREARLLFGELLGYANHLGLYAEELGSSGEHLGNFPQALTHLALISAAYALDRELSGEVRPWAR